jgi:murein DD-endopeptidase MepM/ murein hydrolase activator NlpD
VIKHNQSYSTLYAHLARYAPNVRVGSFVEQGQIIGYVGKTGLATGPHLHYEFQLNGAHRNPLTFRFPGATPVPTEAREAFFTQARMLTARLDLIGRAPSQTLQAASYQP